MFLSPPEISVLLRVPRRCLFCGSFSLFLFQVCHAFLSVLAAFGSSAGKALTSLCVMFSCVYVTFLNCALGQVWYLIMFIPDLCRLSYFVTCR